jgi:exopolysaccharide biosynthesis polyprenyl glycosylphosphotransferase
MTSDGDKKVVSALEPTAGWSWARRYRRVLLATDLVAILIAVAGSQLVWFGLIDVRLQADWRLSVNYTVVSIVFGVAWVGSLTYFGTRDLRVIGIGVSEYKRIADASIRVFGILAIFAFLFQVDPARGYFLTALPVGLFLLLLGRWIWRQWLVAQRRRGRSGSRAVLVGSRSKSEYVAQLISRYPASGLFVAGMIIPNGVAGELIGGVPVLGDLDDLVNALDQSGAEAVVLTGSDDLPHRAVKRLTWELERRGVQLIVVPALTDIAGPRIHTSPIAGLPLIHVDFPTFEGARYATKRLADILTSSLALLLLAPLLVVVAILIKLTSRGPVFFLQTRVGLNGVEFRMLKFRSMRADAEDLLPGLLDEHDGNAVMFKKRSDPRITRVGRVLRRWSIDELPQLINVLRGDMAFVGPRPPLLREVEQYDNDARRRLLVKPGITGLWQISGRSDLSWEDSVRLDLYYVENWSLTGDVIIMYRTVRAVLMGRGAY